MDWSVKQGAKLAELRLKKGFTQDYVAKKLQVNRMSIINWEKGSFKPKSANLRRLAFLYNVPVEEITGEEDDSVQSAAEETAYHISRETGGVYVFRDRPLAERFLQNETFSDLIALMSMISDKTEEQIIDEALRAYAKSFNWTAYITQKYLDGADQIE